MVWHWSMDAKGGERKEGVMADRRSALDSKSGHAGLPSRRYLSHDEA